MTDTLMVGVAGITGIVGKDLTDEVVGRYARAFGRWAKARTPVVGVGRDARASGPAFARAVVDGWGSVGWAVGGVLGAGGPVMRVLLERLGCEVAGINLETDGRFPRSPEPVPENLGGLSTLVTRAGAALGIAVDPDVDRLAIVDESGTPIGEDYTLAFAVRAVLGGMRDAGSGMRRVVVCNLSTSLVVEDAARDYGADVLRTAVGEVHVARAILRLAAVIGGEGNGGVMYPALHAGRDAPVAAGLLLTLLARSGKQGSELVAAAPRRSGERRVGEECRSRGVP